MDETCGDQMMQEFEIEDLKPVVMDLLHREKRKLAFDILELYYPQARTISDYDALGYLSLKAEHRPLYLKCAEAAYSVAENSQQKYIARTNLYKAYNALNQPEKALFYIDLNLSITPDDFETQCQRAFNLALMGLRSESEQLLLELRDKHPERAEDMRGALSGKMLRDGQLAEGIRSFLGTFKPKGGRFDTQLKMKLWQGMAQPGKTLYVEGEGGIGDEIINIRFFKNIEALGMRPILFSAWSKYRVDVVHMFQRMGYEVITETYSIDRSQLWCPMMSLPAYLNLREDQLWTGAYFTALNQSQNQVPSKKFKIGIKCSGNPYFSQDEYRKIPMETLLQYLPTDADIYYIDREPCESHERVTDLSGRIHTWEDTLDLISQMDCIVSSCTSLVHAAGALDKPTFVTVPIAEYYIWSSSSKTTRSPWYGENLQVFKQTKVRSWHEPLSHMQQQLERFMHGAHI